MNSNNIDRIDILLNDTYFHNRKNGTFLQAGAFDGKGDSITYTYQKELGWRGLLLQPNKDMISKIKSVRSPQDVILNLGLGGKTQTAQYQLLPSRLDSSGFNLTEEHKTTLKEKYSFNGISQKQLMQIISYRDLINMTQTKKIDIAVIDVEGMQKDVLKDICLSQVHPTFLVVEHIHSNKQQLLDTVKYQYDLVKDINKDFVLKRRYTVVLLTRCTRPKYLQQIKQSIDNLFKGTRFNYTWAIGFNSKFISRQDFQTYSKQLTPSQGNQIHCKYVTPAGKTSYDGQLFNDTMRDQTGDVTFCLDDDTIMHPQFLKILEQNMDSQWDALVINAQGLRIKDVKQLTAFTCYGNIDAANVIYRLPYLRELGGFTLLGSPCVVQDGMTFSKCLQAGCKVIYTHKQGAYYNKLKGT